MGTASYVCSPGAASTCWWTRSSGLGKGELRGGDTARVKVSDAAGLGVACWTRIGGAWSLKGELVVLLLAECGEV